MFELTAPGAAVAQPLPMNKWLATLITVALSVIYIIALLAPFRFPLFKTNRSEGIVVVTGGGSDIGRSAAYAAAERGFTVLVQVQKRDDAASLRLMMNGSSFAHRLKPMFVAADPAVRISRVVSLYLIVTVTTTNTTNHLIHRCIHKGDKKSRRRNRPQTRARHRRRSFRRHS